MNKGEISQQKVGQVFEALVEVMAQLRGPEGCPWDKKQSHRSLTACLLEETYEVLAAIEKEIPKELQEELGDLLLQVVFHSQIAQERNEFQIKDVLLSLIDKLVRRHPHVFAGGKATHPEDAIRSWERIKAGEKKPGQSMLSGVPEQLPALLRAYRLGAKASRVGFDWIHPAEVLRKVEEELLELHEEIAKLGPVEEKSNEGWAGEASPALEEELGDLLFSLAQLARFLKVNPEDALRKAGHKFQRRFEFIEKRLHENRQEFSDCTAELLNQIWEEAKSFTKSV